MSAEPSQSPADLASRREANYARALTLEATHRAIHVVYRIESARLIAGLALGLLKLGRFEEARLDFERAASLTRNARERELLLARAPSAARGSAPPQPC